MKNTDPPNKFKKLSPELTRFIESMGMYFETSGVPRIGGRILGLLMIAHEPLSAEDIAKILKVSRASISTNFRILFSGGLAEKITFPGDRNTYFTFPESSWEKIMHVEIEAMNTMKKLAQQGLDALPSEDSARSRMEGMIHWAEFLIKMYQNALVEWRTRIS